MRTAYWLILCMTTFAIVYSCTSPEKKQEYIPDGELQAIDGEWEMVDNAIYASESAVGLGASATTMERKVGTITISKGKVTRQGTVIIRSLNLIGNNVYEGILLPDVNWGVYQEEKIMLLLNAVTKEIFLSKALPGYQSCGTKFVNLKLDNSKFFSELHELKK